MKTLLQQIPIITLITFFIGISCENDNTINKCVKGKFIGPYCEGIAIEIMGGSKIGKTWKNPYGIDTYKNSVVASIDSIYAKTIMDTNQFFSKDSIFYFLFREGGYPRQVFNVCEPSAFITITWISKSPCN